MPAGKILYNSLYWKCLQFGSSVLLNILIARVLQASVSAELYYVVYLFSGCLVIFTMGLDIGFSYFLPRAALSRRMTGRLIAGVTLLALVVCIPVFAFWYNPGAAVLLDRSRLLWYAALHITGGLLTTLYGTVLTAYGRNELASKVALVFNVLTGAGCMAAVWLPGDGSSLARTVFAIWFGGSFFQGVGCLWLAAKVSRRSTQGGGRDEEQNDPQRQVTIRRVLRFSLGAFVINFLFFAAARTGLYLLPYRTGRAELGNYIQSYKLVEYLGNLTLFLYYPVIALVAGANQERMKQRLLFLVRLSNTLVLVCSILALSTGYWLFPVVFGNSYPDMYRIFCGFVPGLFATCSSSFFTAWYYGTGLLRVNATSAVIQLIVMIVGFYLFPPGWGTALAFSLSGLCSLGYDLLIFRRYYPWTMADIGIVHVSDLGEVRTFLQKLLRGKMAGEA